MLGENLQKARLAQKLTQEEVAKELYLVDKPFHVGNPIKLNQILKH